MPRAVASIVWPVLKIAFIGDRLARISEVRAEQPTDTTHAQCGAMTALASDGIKEREPLDSRPVWYARAWASILINPKVIAALTYSRDTLASWRKTATPAPNAPKHTIETYWFILLLIIREPPSAV